MSRDPGSVTLRRAGSCFFPVPPFPPGAPAASRAAARARARSSSARASRTRQYSSAGTGRVPLARRRPAATASSRARHLAW